MEAFNNLTSLPVPLCVDNVDTDRIIPARFLKATERKGFGDLLFYDLRFLSSGEKNPDFILNSFSTEQKILLCGKNFGCGSSREHAAWAVYDYGFRVLISTQFADIFYNNAFNIGLLPIVVSEKFYMELKRNSERKTPELLSVDLQNQYLKINDVKEEFSISPFRKNCLLKGYDLDAYLLSFRSKVEKYEKKSLTVQLINQYA